jgi:hypothetical protein
MMISCGCTIFPVAGWIFSQPDDVVMKKLEVTPKDK